MSLHRHGSVVTLRRQQSRRGKLMVAEEEFQTAARTVPGKPREQIGYEGHYAAGEDSQVDGDEAD